MVPSRNQSFASPATRTQRVDTSRFPLVVVEFAANPTAMENRALVDTITRLTARGERCGLVVDMIKLNPLALSALARKELTAMYSANLDARRKALVCVARVIANPLVRGVAVAFDWIAERNWPSATFTDRALAEEWVLAKVSADAKP